MGYGAWGMGARRETPSNAIASKPLPSATVSLDG